MFNSKNLQNADQTVNNNFILDANQNRNTRQNFLHLNSNSGCVPVGTRIIAPDGRKKKRRGLRG